MLISPKYYSNILLNSSIVTDLWFNVAFSFKAAASLLSTARFTKDSTDIVFSPCTDGDFADTGMRLGKLIFGGICRFIANFLVVSRKKRIFVAKS